MDHEARKAKKRATALAWNKANPERVAAAKARRKPGERAKWLKRKYGLTLDGYLAMFEAQGGRCALCDATPGERALAVDHCHSTGKVRGLLCHACNGSLGWVEKPGWLSRVAEYLGKK